MEALFFGSPERQLYGVYHPPLRTRSEDTGVVLCYPVGQEYIRIHRAFRWLATQLAEAGFHVLRFDYSGQGDSAGDFSEARFTQWVVDAKTAVQELVQATGVRRVDVVGLRVGTLIADALSAVAEVRRLVLWEPRASGAVFQQELMAIAKHDASTMEVEIAGASLLAIQGFTFSRTFLEELADAQFLSSPFRHTEALLTVSAEPDDDMDAMIDARRAAGVIVDHHLVNAPTNWNSIDDMGGLFLPVEAMRVIVEWLDDR